jgi:hypothetical protein
VAHGLLIGIRPDAALFITRLFTGAVAAPLRRPAERHP